MFKSEYVKASFLHEESSIDSVHVYFLCQTDPTQLDAEECDGQCFSYRMDYSVDSLENGKNIYIVSHHNFWHGP